MKYFIPLVALFAAGIVASFALAAPAPGRGPHTSSSTSTSSGPGKSGDHAKSNCRPLNLKGTVAGGTVNLGTIGGTTLGPNALQITSDITIAGTGETIQRGGAAKP